MYVERAAPTFHPFYAVHIPEEGPPRIVVVTRVRARMILQQLHIYGCRYVHMYISKEAPTQKRLLFTQYEFLLLLLFL
jgi:hypothetical protein